MPSIIHSHDSAALFCALSSLLLVISSVLIAWWRLRRVRVLGAAMIGLAVGQLYLVDHFLENALSREIERLNRTMAGTAATDQKTTIQLRRPGLAQREMNTGRAEESLLPRTGIVCVEMPTVASNCHGWVFTGGRFLLCGNDVKLILAENGYQAVGHPEADDLVVYYQAGSIVHTAVVYDVTASGEIVVEGKWESMGVYRHPVAASIYGSEYTFYRSERGTHLLAGIEESADVGGES